MKNIIESFFLGIIAALGALIVELVFFIAFSFYSNSAVSLSFFQLFTIPKFIVLGAVIEELLKYIVISKRLETFSLGRLLMLNSFFVGLGFFATETCLSYFSNSVPPSNLLIELAIVHIGTAGFIGYIVASRNPKKISTFILTIFLASIFHVGYNLLILDRTFIVNYAIFGLLGVMLALNMLNIFLLNDK
ncbi:MAG: hypothetical protein ACD_8C00007G0003 [uncultured bacterium]|nr:MAG: hypothetical protein ACD_8C00007G0003 [uncultured bacterium]